MEQLVWEGAIEEGRHDGKGRCDRGTIAQLDEESTIRIEQAWAALTVEEGTKG